MNGPVVAAVAVLFAALLLCLWLVPRGPFVLVITDPAARTGNAIDIIGAAQGAFVSSGKFAWITVAHSDDPNFPAQLMRKGAIAVLNSPIDFICK